MSQTQTKAIRWNLTPEDDEAIGAIVDRALQEAPTLDHVSLRMDLTACHLNDTRLDLPRLLAADAFNFAHDVFGIVGTMDRRTGRLTRCFSPRFAAR